MPRFLGKSRVWGRGYTTIPMTVRRVLDLKNGDHVEWYLGEDGRIYLVRCKEVGQR